LTGALSCVCINPSDDHHCGAQDNQTVACSPFAFRLMCIEDCCRGEVGRNNERNSASPAGQVVILVFGEWRMRDRLRGMLGLDAVVPLVLIVAAALMALEPTIFGVAITEREIVLGFFGSSVSMPWWSAPGG
jgi:hypothetical protein